MTVPTEWNADPASDCFRDVDDDTAAGGTGAAAGAGGSGVALLAVVGVDEVESEAAAAACSDGAYAAGRGCSGAAAEVGGGVSGCGFVLTTSVVDSCSFSMLGRRRTWRAEGEVKFHRTTFPSKPLALLASFLVFLNLNVFLLCAFCRCSLGLPSCCCTSSLAVSDGSEVSPPLSFAAPSLLATPDPGTTPAGLGSPPPGSVLTDDLLACFVAALTTRPRVRTVVFR